MNSPLATPRAATLTFSGADQERFAALSGDRNPMHLDPIAARRLLTGRQVVHGVHTLLCLLERRPHDWPDAAWRLEAEFLNPLSVGDEAAVAFDHGEDGAPQALASVQGLVACRVSLRGAPAPLPGLAIAADAEVLQTGAHPLDREPTAWVGRQQRLPLPAADFAADFPRACARLGERRVAAMALLSTYVGMACPGLHSVFSSLTLEPAEGPSDVLRFEVKRYDARFRLFVIAFDGLVRGDIKAFLRAPAQAQASMAELRALLRPDEFAGATHWIIGGSRGLGELVAKLLAAGGGRACLSYASGALDAERVVQEIAAAGAPAATPRRLDLLTEGFDEWLRATPWPDAVWYFATPRIYRKRAQVFDAALFDEFVHFYVRRFEALCQALEAAADGRTVRVFYPSTVFIDERPKGMTEYAMAKAAAEVLIADLARTLRWVKPVAHRLPRLATDQTAGLSAAGGSSNAQALLPLLRELMAG